MSLKQDIESVIGEEITGNMHGTGPIRTNSGKIFFLKCGLTSGIYHCEANGLHELAKSNTVRIAKVIAVNENYLLTEYIHPGHISPDFYSLFGKKLAQMHRYQHKYFGFYEDNFIGANPQPNIPGDQEKTDWIAFYLNKRLLFQYRLAEKNRYLSPTLRSGFFKLEVMIETILKESIEPPTLLHGDLWRGNYMCDPDGNPVLIDPAVYYGNREANLAMTKVFGGFTKDFYRSYMEEYPLKDGWEYRENIYKLYHILNHLNIFGSSYLSEAEYLVRFYTEK